MKFEEAIDKIDVNGTLIDTLGVLQALQQEYAPTIEMTKSHYRQFIDFINRTDFVQTQAVTLHEKTTKYPKFLNESIGGICGKEFLQAWLHPETIKVVDE